MELNRSAVVHEYPELSLNMRCNVKLRRMLSAGICRRGVLVRSSPTYCQNLKFNTAKLRFQPVLQVWPFCTGPYHCCLRFRLRIHGLYSMEATTYNENMKQKKAFHLNSALKRVNMFLVLCYRICVSLWRPSHLIIMG